MLKALWVQRETFCGTTQKTASEARAYHRLSCPPLHFGTACQQQQVFQESSSADLSKSNSHCWGNSTRLLDLVKTLRLDSVMFLKSSTMLLPGLRGWSLSWVMLTHSTPTTTPLRLKERHRLKKKKVRHQALSSLITFRCVSSSKKENVANSASTLRSFCAFFYKDILTVNRSALLFTQATNSVLSLLACIVNPE